MQINARGTRNGRIASMGFTAKNLEEAEEVARKRGIEVHEIFEALQVAPPRRPTDIRPLSFEDAPSLFEEVTRHWVARFAMAEYKLFLSNNYRVSGYFPRPYAYVLINPSAQFGLRMGFVLRHDDDIALTNWANEVKRLFVLDPYAFEGHLFDARWPTTIRSSIKAATTEADKHGVLPYIKSVDCTLITGGMGDRRWETQNTLLKSYK